MKIYVAGISFESMLFVNTTHSEDTLKKTQHIIATLGQIRKDADAFDSDSVALVILQEYALTEKAIPNKIKKECLQKLETAVKTYKNLILIPGSFAAYEKFSDGYSPEQKAKKIEKILANYTAGLDVPLYKNDDVFVKEYFNSKTKLANDAPETLCLQNSSYIITSELNSKKQKHKKSFPWNEKNKLEDSSVNNFLNIGSDNPIKKITIGGKELKIGLIICREHHVITSETDQVKKDLPELQVLISDSVKLNKDNLFGAVNIHMDSIHGMAVHIDDEHIHSKLKKISDVKGSCYYPTNLSTEQKEISISHFNKQGKSEVKQNKDSDELSSNKDNTVTKTNTSLKKGFFHNPVNEKKATIKFTGFTSMKKRFLNKLHIRNN